ncbi:SMI1/KNR4 family protein [Paenibacillus fonticola]|uniref:SMI1/KNR4 family protein n=1 Tax=Paenibacillus fonticola TaxID=379896 RepID=UPI000376CA61|nr:SMI1/KNR4 family protein [Paenibacillus fonticola]
MNTSLIHSAEGLIEKVKEKYPDYKGKIATIEEMESLQNQLGIILPKDLIHLYTAVPIIDAEFGFQEYEPEPDFDGISYILWGGIKDILDESLRYQPGIHVLKEGYLFVANCSHGSGDPIFIKFEEEGKYGVYRIFHDDISISKVSDSLTELFYNAKL